MKNKTIKRPRLVFQPRSFAYQGGRYALNYATAPILKLVFGTNAHTNSAYAPSADVLKMLLHVFGAKLGIEIARTVRFWFFPKNRARRTGLKTKGAIPAAVLDYGQFVFQR